MVVDLFASYLAGFKTTRRKEILLVQMSLFEAGYRFNLTVERRDKNLKYENI